MKILPSPSNPSHPGFCSPDACQPHLYADGDVQYEHRSGGMVMCPSQQRDAELSVIWTQFDDRGLIPSVSEVSVTLVAEDTASLRNGQTIKIDVDLSPADARGLAAMLLSVADQVEAARRAEPKAA